MGRVGWKARTCARGELSERECRSWVWWWWGCCWGGLGGWAEGLADEVGDLCCWRRGAENCRL